MSTENKTPLLDVRDLRVEFRTPIGVVHAVDGLSYQLFENEIVGIVGESGCGKSASQLAVMQLLQSPPGFISGGEVIFDGKDLAGFKRNSPEMRAIRGGQIAMIFQEPMTSLNPVATIGDQLVEAVKLHCGLGGQSPDEVAAGLLKMVGIPGAERRVKDYPHQFSGGMCQRVMIAMGLSCSPRLLIADEPTTALDVTTQAQMLELMKKLVQQFGASLVIVTHNLGVVARYVQRIYVMYAGRVVEEGTTKDIFGRPSPSLHARASQVGTTTGRGAGHPADTHRGHAPQSHRHAGHLRLLAPLPLLRRALPDRPVAGAHLGERWPPHPLLRQPGGPGP